MGEKGTLYFFTGLAGAGKTTIGGLFYERLKEKKPNAMLLDGDRQRTAAGHNTGDTATVDSRYTTQARKAGAQGLFQYCRDLTEQGLDVVCCSISMYREIRAWNRANIEHYAEIYVKVTRETLYKRDQKGLYSSGAKNVVGVDLPYDEPECPDVVIQNDGGETPEAIVERLEKRFLNDEGE